VSLLVSEFIYLKFAQIINGTTRTIRIEVGSSIPYLVWNLDHSSSCIRSIQ
jgi:hypothetical protein